MGNRASKKGRRLARVNDDIAKSKGDDISKWWVVDRKVPMSKAQKFTDINFLRGEE